MRSRLSLNKLSVVTLSFCSALLLTPQIAVSQQTHRSYEWSYSYTRSLPLGSASGYHYLPRSTDRASTFWSGCPDLCSTDFRTRADGQIRLAICMGLDEVDPDYYGDNKLTQLGAVVDAKKMYDFAYNSGFHSILWKNGQATWPSLRGLLSHAAKHFKAGDTLLVTFAGKGGLLPDKHCDSSDGLGKTWCLYNGQVFLDELTYMWSLFELGVNIIVISDTCHRVVELGKDIKEENVRFMPTAVSAKILETSQAFYYSARRGQLTKEQTAESSVKANVIFWSACQEHQTAIGKADGGVFTNALMKILREGGARNFKELQKDLKKDPKIATQQPEFSTMGGSVNKLLERSPYSN